MLSSNSTFSMLLTKRNSLSEQIKKMYDEKKEIDEALTSLYAFYDPLKTSLSAEYQKLNDCKSELESAYKRKETLIEKKKGNRLITHQAKSYTAGTMSHVTSAKTTLSNLHERKSRLYDRLESIKREIDYAYSSRNYYTLDRLKEEKASIIRDIEDLKWQIQNQKSIIESYQRDLSNQKLSKTFNYETSQATNRELDEISAKISTLKEEKQNIISKITSLKEKIAPFSQEIEKLKSQKNDIKNSIEKFKKERDEINYQLSLLSKKQS